MATKTVSAPKTTSKSSVPAPKTSAPSAPDSRDYGKSVSYTPNNYSFRNSAPSTAPDSRDYGKSVSYTPSAQTSALYKNDSSSNAVDSRDYGKSVSYMPNDYSFRNSSTNTGGSSVGGSVGQMATQANVPVPTYSPPPTYAAPGTLPPVPTAKANVPPMQTESVQAPQTAVASAVSTGGTTSNVPAPKHPLDYYLSEIGRSQLAYGEYKGRADLQNLAHQNADNLKAQAKADKYDLTPYLKDGFTKFYNKEGPAGAYDPAQSGKVQRSVPAPGGPNQTTGNPVTDAQNGLVYKPNESPYAFRTEQQIQAQEHAKTENLIAQQKALASQKKAAYQLSYDRMNAQEADQRALENNQFERNNNPYSGGSDYRRAMLDRERAITDRGQNEDLMTKLAATDSELYNYIQNASVEEQDRILKQVESERNASLQWRAQDFAEQKGVYDSNRNAFESNRNFTLEQDKYNYTKQSDQVKMKLDTMKMDLEAAINRADKFGAVTSKEDAQLLGVPVGTPTLEARKAAVEKWYKEQSIGIDNQNVAISKQKVAQDATQHQDNVALQQAAQALAREKFDFDKNQETTKNNNKKATDGYTATAMGYSSRADAIGYITANIKDILKDGGDVTQILRNMDAKFPGIEAQMRDALDREKLGAGYGGYTAPKQVGG